MHDLAYRAHRTMTPDGNAVKFSGFALFSLCIVIANTISILPPPFLIDPDSEIPSLISQFVIAALFLSLLAIEIFHPNTRLRSLLRRFWPLVALIGLAVTSTLWSDYPDATLRRSLRLAMTAGVILMACARIQRLERALSAITWVGSIALAVSVILIAGGWGRSGAELTGVFSHSNTLGAVASLLSITAAGAAWSGRRTPRIFEIIVSIAWITLAVSSGSRTAMFALLTAATAGFILSITKFRLGSLGPIPGIPVLMAFSVSIWVFLDGPTALEFLGLDGETFTGRTYIWDVLRGLFEKNWLVGAGYGGVWDVGDRGYIEFNTNNFITTLRQAHNGYIDVLVALGIVGYALMMGFVFVVISTRAETPATSFLIFATVMFSLVHNLQETQFLRSDGTIWILLLIVAASVQSSANDARLHYKQKIG